MRSVQCLSLQQKDRGHMHNGGRESLTIFAACEEEKGEEREREIQTKMGKGIFLFLSLQKGNKLFFFLFLQMSSRKEPSEFAEHHIQGSHFVVPRRYSNLQALGALSFPFPFFFSFLFLFFFFFFFARMSFFCSSFHQGWVRRATCAAPMMR